MGAATGGRAEVRLEVCVETVDAARAAEAGGADRIELCSALAEDGLSPDAALMRATRAAVSIPIVAMVRPRAGDFCADAALLARMGEDLQRARDCGMDGVVLGILDAGGALDLPAVEGLVARAADLPVTFHRAFDRVPDPLTSLETLVELGVRRVLTSGGAASAPEGEEPLAQLVERARERIVVMPGGGVRASNAARLRERTRAREFHSSVGFPEALRAEAVQALVEALRMGG